MHYNLITLTETSRKEREVSRKKRDK
jgi:hypothetical protein